MSADAIAKAKQAFSNAELESASSQRKQAICMEILETAEDETILQSFVTEMFNNPVVGSSVARQVFFKIGEEICEVGSSQFRDFVLEEICTRDQCGDISLLFLYGAAKQKLDVEDFDGALRELNKIRLNTIVRDDMLNWKFKVLMMMCKILLHQDESAKAYRILQSQARPLTRNLKDDDLMTQFQYWESRCLDHSRKFVDAATAYIKLSYKENISASERTTALSRAVSCAILGPVGERRLFQLTTLYKDDRCRAFPSFEILEKVYLGRMISAEEKSRFADLLEKHHLAITSDATLTILDRALIEHNSFAITKLYRNIRISQLAIVLGISETKAEEIAANMIAQQQIFGSIDQVAGVIHFDSDKEISHWDANIDKNCSQLNNILNKIADFHPDWIEGKGV